jgi:hypothetical protein
MFQVQGRWGATSGEDIGGDSSDVGDRLRVCAQVPSPVTGEGVVVQYRPLLRRISRIGVRTERRCTEHLRGRVHLMPWNDNDATPCNPRPPTARDEELLDRLDPLIGER